MKTGRIIRSLSGYYDIQTSDGTVERTRARGEFRKSGKNHWWAILSTLRVKMMRD